MVYILSILTRLVGEGSEVASTRHSVVWTSDTDKGYSYETTHNRFDDTGEEERDWLRYTGILVTVEVESKYEHFGEVYDVAKAILQTLTFLTVPSTVMFFLIKAMMASHYVFTCQCCQEKKANDNNDKDQDQRCNCWTSCCYKMCTLH